MNEENKPLIFFWSFMAVATLILVWYQYNTQPPVAIKDNPQAKEQQQVLNIYRDNCARCHGAFGEGFASNPVLRGRNLQVEYIKDRIVKGRGKMPGFPNIVEPQLSKLAE